jgi:small subunit ribosomal protein S9
MPRTKKTISGTTTKKTKEKTEAEVELEVAKPEVKKVEKIKKDKKIFIFTTGKRKCAVARIRFSDVGSGSILVNKKDYKIYFPYFVWQEIVVSPLNKVGLKTYEIEVMIHGGGLRAQAESVRLGIARALVEKNQENRKILKAQRYLSRDARIKERKKPGLKRARRAPQWNKR